MKEGNNGRNNNRDFKEKEERKRRIDQ